jgi:hypothetical protein
MTMRRVLNVAWALAIEGLEPEGIEKVRSWLHEKPKSAMELAEEERKRKAAENKASISNLSHAFSLGK